MKVVELNKQLGEVAFAWGIKKSAVVGGYGSFYNTSAAPNADFTLNKKQRVVTLRAIKPIRDGQEVTIDYGVKLWFKMR